MIIKENEKLSNYSTLKIGGVASKLYFPQSEAELIELQRNQPTQYILGGGSNLLINDEKCFDKVISLAKLPQKLDIDPEGTITASASVKVRKFLKFVADNNLGGAEYLNSLPACVGGLIVMNAGRGKKFNQMISDYLVDVKVLHNGEIKTVLKEECQFGYRSSKFQSGEYTILSARFKFKKQQSDIGKKLLMERTNHSRLHQDLKRANAGSVFKVSNPKILSLFRKWPIKKRTELYFSDKTNNWISNGGAGSYRQAMKMIRRVKWIHKLCGKQCVVEWVIWD